MRVVLLADGKSKPNHLGNHRLLTPISGEPLIARTIRQFSPFAQVEVLTSDPTIRQAVKPDGFLPGSDEANRFFAADMIRKGLEAFDGPRFVFVFGDVMFTDDAVDIIVNHAAKRWAVYGRSKVVSAKVAPYGEYFAVEVNTSRVVDAGFKALHVIAEKHRRGEWRRCTAWEWYFEMENLPYRIADSKNIQVGSHWVEINDDTDDIDLPQDLERLGV